MTLSLRQAKFHKSVLPLVWQTAFLDQDPIKTCDLTSHNMQEQEQMIVCNTAFSLFSKQFCMSLHQNSLPKYVSPLIHCTLCKVNKVSQMQKLGNSSSSGANKSFTGLTASFHVTLLYVWHNDFKTIIFRNAYWQLNTFQNVQMSYNWLCLIDLTSQLWEGSQLSANNSNFPLH